MNNETAQPEEEEIILLQDLVPRHSVKGGAGRLVFGQAIGFAEDDFPPPPSTSPDGNPNAGPDAASPDAPLPASSASMRNRR